MTRVYPISNYGIAASELNSKQKDGLAAIIDVYLSNMPPPVAKERSEKLMGAGMDQITFTWAGSGSWRSPLLPNPRTNLPNRVRQHTEQGQPHPRSLAGLHGDFGRDLLWEHHKNAH